jgi:hypothetical protein
MDYRRASNGDFEKMVVLQDKYVISNLAPDQRSDGYLSGKFSAEQFADFNRDLCAVVADDASRLAGYLCASSNEFNKQFGLSGKLVSQYPHINFNGRSLDKWNSFVSGPICVESDYRGQGIFPGLYDRLFTLVPEDYDVAVVLVSLSNPRSQRAHEKIGMISLDKFEFDGRRFAVLARMIR